MEFIWFIVIGGVAGWLAGLLFKGSGFGILGNIIVGILGGFVGGWLAGLLEINFGGLLGQLLVAAGGAIVLLWVVSLFKRK
ncbi:GlsB/YeaQ/YmgE family stress response membrane protein [Galbibacter sp. EGI 63066]|uniref:GlsB/YeaQ/YmgE family stress response membrane protein n=1 Tax=Galbibacter sp. EGI 63066 TaxID=2993559 RepID=UPI0022498BAC|nr:GlsB/YeaQ/YmgE family stress response membrane protein [Galbibacter sp. EGI 63066]MCX2678359.1 GlsB/YeaQ/YmgE family stress response membrane protein [Galbibacter sp. EGI 63066]